MPLNIKNAEVERLAEEIARLTGETKTEAIRRALLDRRARLRLRVTSAGRMNRLRRFLVSEVWARIAAEQLGSPPGRRVREEILGYGEDGV